MNHGGDLKEKGIERRRAEGELGGRRLNVAEREDMKKGDDWPEWH